MKKITIQRPCKLRQMLLMLGISFLGFSSCQKDEIDTTPPGVPIVTEIKALNGGGLITFTLPADEDLLYVKAEYTNSQGNNVFRVSSRFNNTIEVDGFNDTLSHTIQLFAVDQNNNQSDPVDVSLKPLESFIYIVESSVQLVPDLGGVKINWTNPVEKTVFVYLYYEYNNDEQYRILSSNKAEESFIVRGLDSVDYNFSIMVEDFNGNKTEKTFIESLKPLFEEKIDKTTWVLDKALSIDGNAWEGVTENFWDDVVDTKDSPADNSYFIINRDNNGGMLNYPLDIVIDMNKSVILNRFVVWQRAYWYISGNNGVSQDYYYYQNENMRSFDLFASNDKQEWLLLGNFDIGDPKDADGNVSPDKIQEAIDGHEFELENTSVPFRYLKFSISSSFGSETNVYGSEITLYGLDNVQ